MVIGRPIELASGPKGHQMAELVDALDSGASVLYGRGGSSPLLGTNRLFSLIEYNSR